MKASPLVLLFASACGASACGASSDEGVAAADGGVVDAATVDAGPAFDCDTLELRAPGYETLPIATSFTAGEAPRGPGGSARAITEGRVYRRTAVAEYGGEQDSTPPLPTLIAFDFEPGSNQLAGQYCVVQAQSSDGGVTHGHFLINFVPRTPGSTTDFFVTATLGQNSFPIGFDGDGDELTIYVSARGSDYLETYQLVQ